MVTMGSPTLELIKMRGAKMPGGNEDVDKPTPTTEERLRGENYNLRKKIAALTAQYIWSEGGSFAKIDAEIRQYGFMLEKMEGAYDPRIIPLKEKLDV